MIGVSLYLKGLALREITLPCNSATCLCSINKMVSGFFSGHFNFSNVAGRNTNSTDFQALSLAFGFEFLCYLAVTYM